MIYVVETDEGDCYLGRLAVNDGRLEVLNGFQGHPVQLDPEAILSVVPADEHPDCEEVYA